MTRGKGRRVAKPGGQRTAGEGGGVHGKYMDGIGIMGGSIAAGARAM